MVKWRYGLREMEKDGETWLDVVEVYANDDSGDEWLTQASGLGWCIANFNGDTAEEIVATLENAIKDIKRERGIE